VVNRSLLRKGSLAQLVELYGAFSQHLTPVSLRELLGDHGWRPREKPVSIRVVGRPQNLLRPQALGQMRQAALHRLKGNPALPGDMEMTFKILFLSFRGKFKKEKKRNGRKTNNTTLR
jgi:hypothetical protein